MTGMEHPGHEVAAWSIGHVGGPWCVQYDEVTTGPDAEVTYVTAP